MYRTQNEALDALIFNGYHEEATEASQNWNAGKKYEPEDTSRFTRWINKLIDQCNWELERASQS